MTEVMLFTQLKTHIDCESETIIKLFEYDLENQITFAEARYKWPELLTENNLDFGSEPMLQH